MKRIASWLSEIEDCKDRGLEQYAQQICGDVMSWVRGGIQEWGDYPEPDHVFPITTTLRIQGDLHRNGLLLSVANDDEARRLHLMLTMYVLEALRRTERDPALGCPLRVSILFGGGENNLEVMY